MNPSELNERSHQAGGLVNSGRRKFLGVTGAAAASMIVGAGDADAGWFGYSSKPVAGIPSSWVKLKGTDVYRYANYIKSLRLRNITPRMVLAPHFKSRGRVTNTLPPKKIWKKMGPTLKVIDRIVKEPAGGAHRDPETTARNLGKALSEEIDALADLPSETLIRTREERFLQMGG